MSSFADHILYVRIDLSSIVDDWFFQIIANHIIKVHASAGRAGALMGESKPSKEENWLKRYAMLLTFQSVISTICSFNHSRK